MKKIVVTLNDDLIINFVNSTKLVLLAALDKSSSFNIDLSQLKSIDVSGLQLLIALYKEVSQSKKEIAFIGSFTDEFIDEINKITYTSDLLFNSDDLTNFIKETI